MTSPTIDQLESKIERLIQRFETLQTENALLKDAHSRLDQQNADLHRCHREAHMRLEKLIDRIRSGDSLADLLKDKPKTTPSSEEALMETTL